MIVAARTSPNPYDFALVAMLGLLGLRVFEACNSTIDDLLPGPTRQQSPSDTWPKNDAYDPSARLARIK